ncbi:hypothetical protein HOY82DRAFT_598020 [Tuber indicum]|nr:hypothetical protein HOY82DRAFT_598020 [Tuber indicum]
MPRDYSDNTIWTKDETEILMQWLEDPENLRKIKKGSGITKTAIVAEIATHIPTKEVVKVGYKYDNLMKAYRAAAKLNNQSGWGLSETDLDGGRRYKLLSRCPYFFRLERILGDRPNVRPPITYDSGTGSVDTAATIEQLVAAMCNDNPEDSEEAGPPMRVGSDGLDGGVEVEEDVSMEGLGEERERPGDEGREAEIRSAQEEELLRIGDNSYRSNCQPMESQESEQREGGIGEEAAVMEERSVKGSCSYLLLSLLVSVDTNLRYYLLFY